MKKTITITRTANAGMTMKVRLSGKRQTSRYSDEPDHDQYLIDEEIRNYKIRLWDYVGKDVIVGIRSYTLDKDSTRDSIFIREDNGKGLPGNSNPSIFKYNGWCGTTDDVAIYAAGLRRLESFKVTGKYSRLITVKFGKDVSPAGIIG